MFVLLLVLNVLPYALQCAVAGRATIRSDEMR